MTSPHPKLETSNEETEPTVSTSVVTTATNEKVQQQALNRALKSLENAEEQRRQKRAEKRRPTTPHILRRKWFMWAKQRAFQMAMEYSELTHEKISTKIRLFLVAVREQSHSSFLSVLFLIG